MRLLPLLTLLFPICMHAQEVVPVTVEDKNSGTTEEYHVLASDNKTKHGYYLNRYKEYKNEEGFYKNGKKDSTWTDYQTFERKIASRGNYIEGERTGEWEYYLHPDYQLGHIYNYTTHQLVYIRADLFDSSRRHKFISGGDTVFATLSRPVYYAEGLTWAHLIAASNFDTLYSHNARNPHYPGHGDIEVGIWIDENGIAEDPFMIRSFKKKWDEFALKAAALIPPHWIPAQKDGKNVKALFTIHYKLTRNGPGVQFFDK